MINNVGEQLFAILDAANGTVSAIDICGMVIGGTCAHESKRLYHWTLDIPDLDADPPTLPPIWPKASNDSYKVLHLSDPHVQLDYAIGASTDCGKAVCCSSSDPPPKEASKAAGLLRHKIDCWRSIRRREDIRLGQFEQAGFVALPFSF